MRMIVKSFLIWMMVLVMMTATNAPKQTNTQLADSPEIANNTPKATPANAEWAMASAKNAMRELTTCVPTAAVIGASIKVAINARFIKGCSSQEKSMIQP